MQVNIETRETDHPTDEMLGRVAHVPMRALVCPLGMKMPYLDARVVLLRAALLLLLARYFLTAALARAIVVRRKRLFF
jgi:hypothetical protein